MFSPLALAQEAPEAPAEADADDVAARAKAEAMKEANNPLSDLTSVSFQDYGYLGLSRDDTTPEPAGLANAFYLRFAKAFGPRVLTRISLPVLTTRQGGATGLGDLNIILPIIVTNPGSNTSFGIGPMATFPTHTDPALGADAWGIGASAVVFYTGANTQIGSLLTYNYNLSPDTDADRGNFLAYQPFLFFQIGGGFYIRSSAIMTFDMVNNAHNIPLGLGLGKVLPTPKGLIFNFYAEMQQSIWHHGLLQPLTQVFFGGNVQFVSKKKPKKKGKKAAAEAAQAEVSRGHTLSPFTY